MEKEPTRRYQSAREMEEDLHRFLEDEPIQARKASSAERFVRWSRRNRTVAVLTMTVIGLLTVLVVVASLGYATAIRGWKVAQLSEEEANAARDAARESEGEAQKRRREAEERLYMSDMNRVQQAYDDGNLRLVLSLLTKYAPSFKEPSERDLRGPEWYSWWRAANRQQAVLLRGGRLLSRTVCSPAGPVIAAGNVGETRVTVVEFSPMGKTSRRELVAESPIHDMAFVRRGSLLVAAAADGLHLYVWDTATWTPQPKLSLAVSGASQALCAAFAVTPGDKSDETLAIATTDGQLSLFDTQSWQLKKSLNTEGRILTLAVSPDASTVLAGVEITTGNPGLGLPATGKIVAWDLSTGSSRTLGGICQGIYALAFSNDGRWFATGGADRMVQIGNAETLEWLATFPIGGWVQELAFSPNSQRLAAASRSDNAVRVWDVESRSLLHDVKGHVREVLAVAFLDDNRLVSTGLYGDMKLWDLDKLQDPCIISGHFYRLACSASGDMLSAASMGGQIQVFDARTGKAVVRRIGAAQCGECCFLR